MRGKIVRKLAAAGLSAVVAVSASVPVFAADKSYSISEIGDMNISLPEDITVIDRNAPDSAEYFKLFGLDYNTVMSQMDSNNVYLQGMDSTASLTVTLPSQSTSPVVRSYSCRVIDRLRSWLL